MFCLNNHIKPQTTKNDNTMNRKPAVAGQFYSGDESSLRNDLIHLFAPAKERKKDAIAVISPHAGYVFSGEVAASAISQLNPEKKYENIFIIASSHTSYFDGASIYNIGNYETPLGEVFVNTQLCNELINNNSVFSFHADAHKTEHSIEVQLPLLQFHLQNDFNIVPIVIGTSNISEIQEIANVLKPYFTENNAFVISSDFSHYPDYENAVKIDSITCNALCGGNPENFIEIIQKYKKSNISNLATNICGWSAALTLMYLTNQDYKYNKIQYKNSGDSEYGSHDRVVGYWAISITAADNSAFQLNDEEKIQLLKIARISIESKIDKNISPELSGIDFSENLNSHCGAFVTLHKNNDLRGCIGRFEPDIPLYEVVIEMAIAASQKDHRFLPVTKSELDEIDIEISVLTPMKKIDSISEIELGKHGIYIKSGYRGGTFLPQVATETGWTLEEFLGHCSRDKAGLSYDGWKDADIYTYEAIIFSEKDFGISPQKKAMYYEKLDNNKVICKLCPHECILKPGVSGLCNARKNENGDLISMSYGKIVAVHVDPVEKKPLYHFYPGSHTFSIGTAGCNLHCKNCQNSSISQVSPMDIDFTEASPEQIVYTAIKNNCNSISYTYSEPTVFYEFMLKTAKLAHEKGLKNIIVSNGFINQEPLLELIPFIDAANIDLKCFSDSIYRDITTASLQPILNTLKTLKEQGVWLEITNLVIPNHTDNLKMIEEMCKWLSDNGFEDVPLHFSRFHPSYKMQDVPSTPLTTLEQAYSIAKKHGIKYVYLGNVNSEKRNTICPYCNAIVVERNGFEAQTEGFTGTCPECGKIINGNWK